VEKSIPQLKITANKMQLFLNLSIFTDTLHVWGGNISSTVAASDSIGWQYLKLFVQLRAPDDGRRNRLKHVPCLYK
jgi:hypothetical protein